MNTRDKLMDLNYFNERINFIEIENSNFSNDIKNIPEQYSRIELLYHFIFVNNIEILIAKYSAGYDLSILNVDFNKIVISLEEYQKQPNSDGFYFADSFDDYERALWLISLGVLLKVEVDIFNRLLKCIKNEGVDALYDTIVAKYFNNIIVVSNKTLCYESKFSFLLEATLLNPDEAQMNVKDFLTNWYKNMEECYWYDNHKGPDGGGYFGYWCFEAAAISYLFKIENSLFREMPFYPKDLVDFALIK